MSEEALKVSETLRDHGYRLQSLEQSRIEQEKLNGVIQNQLTTTENTVLKESAKQQEMTKQLLDHVLKSDVYTRKAQREHKRYAQREFWKLIGAIFGSGGFVFILMQFVF